MKANENTVKQDSRPAALGLARLLFLAFGAFGIFALIAESRLAAASTDPFSLGQILSFLTVGLWILGTIGLIHNGRRMRKVAGWSFMTIILASIIVTVIGFFDVRVATSVTMLGMAGAHYYYIPIIGSVAALSWLVWSNPRRLSGR